MPQNNWKEKFGLRTKDHYYLREKKLDYTFDIIPKLEVGDQDLI